MTLHALERTAAILGGVALTLLALGGPFGVSWAISSALVLAGLLAVAAATWVVRVAWVRWRPGSRAGVRGEH